MSDAPDPPEPGGEPDPDAGGEGSVVRGRTADSPEPGPADSLVLRLVPGDIIGVAPLMLHAAFDISVTVTGRYSAPMPAPVLLVAVADADGRVFVEDLTREEDLPPLYLGESAPPAIVREGADGPSSAGISELGWFRVDVQRHLDLPAAGGIYHIFLWLEEVLSEVATVPKPAEPGESPGRQRGRRPPAIALLRPAPPSGRLELGTGIRGGERVVTGQCGAGPVSVIGFAVRSRQLGWTVLEALPGMGLAFEMEAEALVPGASPGEPMLVLAMAGGRRSPLLRIPAPD